LSLLKFSARGWEPMSRMTVRSVEWQIWQARTSPIAVPARQVQTSPDEAAIHDDVLPSDEPCCG
jgi:hypothetical protein